MVHEIGQPECHGVLRLRPSHGVVVQDRIFTNGVEIDHNHRIATNHKVALDVMPREHTSTTRAFLNEQFRRKLCWQPTRPLYRASASLGVSADLALSDLGNANLKRLKIRARLTRSTSHNRKPDMSIHRENDLPSLVLSLAPNPSQFDELGTHQSSVRSRTSAAAATIRMRGKGCA